MRIVNTDNVREIGASLMRNKTRSFLTGFGIFWGVLMLLVMWSGGAGLAAMLGHQFEGFAKNSACLFPSLTSVSHQGFNKGRTWQMDNTDMLRLQQNVSGIKEVVPMLSRYGLTASCGPRTTSGPLKGATSGYFTAIRPKVTAGRLIDSGDNRLKRKVIVLGQRRADELFGSGAALGRLVTVAGTTYTVVGVITDLSQGVNMDGSFADSMIVPFTLMQQLFGYGDRVNWLFVTFRDGSSYKATKPQIRQTLYQAHSIAPDDGVALSDMDIGSMSSMIYTLLFGVRLLALIVGAGTLLAGAIGVTNIMLVILKERTPEIGIRRALGATPAQIMRQLIYESITLTLIAGLSGLALAVAIMAAMQHITGDPYVISLGEALVITAIFLAMGLAAGVLPARRSLEIKPIDAIRGS